MTAVADRDGDQDAHWMAVALSEAQAAGAVGDVPVGAVVCLDNDTTRFFTGQNRRERDSDPTAHAEVVALRNAARALGHWYVEGTLYVTQEPCPMCAGALVNARVRRLVYGCDNPKAGAVKTLFQLVSDPRLNHRVDVISGVLAEQCATELRQFFARLRA